MRVGIYGLGRFGYLWASALAQHFSVLAANRSAGRALPAGVRAVPLAGLADCEAIFLCVAISAIEEAVKQLAGLIRPDTTLLDTCSVKRYPLEVMERLLPPRVQIIGTHPMFGPDSAGGGIAGLPLIYCPRRAAQATIRFWRNSFVEMGLQVLEMDADEHDRRAAYSQGITHFIGRLLRRLDLQPSSIATLGYRKLLEVADQTCNDPYQLFIDLQSYNSYTASMQADLRRAFEALMHELGQPEAE